MLIAKLLAGEIKSQEPVCFGPFCNTISTLAPGKDSNGMITQLLSSTLGNIISLFVIFIGLSMLLYLLWGAFDWVVSAGEKEKLEKAQQKITQAIIGIIIVFAVLMLFGLLAGDILGIIIRNADGSWTFKLPILSQ